MAWRGKKTLVGLTVTLGFFALAAAGCTGSAPTSSGKLRVAATFFPVADIVRQIGGTDIEVVTLLPPGASPHGFEPAPEQARQAAGTKVLFALGHGIDDWAKDLAAPGAGYVVLDTGIRLKPPLSIPYFGKGAESAGGSVDPHYWLSAQNGKIMAQDAAAELKRLDPAHAADYDRNLQTFTASLDSVDGRIKDLFKDKLRRDIVTHHAAWQYFADAYGLRIVGVIQPSPDQELTPNELAALEDVIRTNHIKTIFIEPELSEQTVDPLARDLGLKISKVDPEGGMPGIKDFQDMLLVNATTFAQGL